MYKLKEIDWRDVGARALKTFLQTFIAYLTVDELFSFTDARATLRLLLTAAVSALAAAVSAVWNMTLGLLVPGKGGEGSG